MLPKVMPSGGTPTTQDFVSLQTQWASQLDRLLASAQSGDGIPVGMPAPWFLATAPLKWLLWTTQPLLASQYPDLFSVLGTKYNQTGDPGDRFRLPPISGRLLLFSGDSSATGHTPHALGDTGGEETHTLTIAEMPAHTHPVTANAGGVGNNNFCAQTGNNSPLNTGSTGGGGAHNTLPPYFCANLIIKYLP